MIPAPYRGLNLHPIWYADATIESVLSLLSTSRVQQVRIDMPLNFLSTGRGTIHPGYQERLTRFITGCPSSIEILVVAGYAPTWANGGGGQNIPWTSNADFASTFELLLTTWPTVPAWEVWNEPDQDYSWAVATGTPVQRSAAYVAMLSAVVGDIRSAGAKVVAPAISGLTSGPWLSGFYEANPHGLYDVLSTHVYGDPPSHGGLTPVEMAREWATEIWPIMATNGDGETPIWFTESGWNTSPTGVTVDQQAANLTATYQALDAQVPSCKRLYWYELLDDRADSTPADCYGLLNDTLGQKGDGSAWTAFQALP